MTAAKRFWMVVGLGAVGYLLPLVVTGTYRHSIMALLAAYSIGAVGFTLLLGIAGQISLAPGAFMAIGGYATSYFSLKLGLSPLLTVPLGGVVAAGVGFLMGFPALRLSGQYLALVSMTFAMAVPQLAIKWEAVTGGMLGLFPKQFPSERIAYWVILTVLLLMVWIALNLRYSRPGRALLGLRESEVAAQAMGVDLAWVKTGIFALSSFYAGIAGGLATHLIGYINPWDYGFVLSVEFLAIAVVGGMGSVPGSLAGTILIMMVTFLFSRVAGWATIAQGLVIMLVVRFFPGGLAALGNLIRARIGGGRREAA